MALIECPECSKSVSSTISSCIHCGFQLGTKTKTNRNLKTTETPEPTFDPNIEKQSKFNWIRKYAIMGKNKKYILALTLCLSLGGSSFLLFMQGHQNSVEAQISVSGYSACALETTGKVSCWGSELPKLPSDLHDIKSISLGSLGSELCVITSQDFVNCWGDGYPPPNDLGQVSSIGVGSGFICSLGKDQKVKCWGGNSFGTSVPHGLEPATQLSVGFNHACVITTLKNVQCWGDNLFGQLDVPHDLSPAKQVSVGYNHSCATLEDRTVSCWGNVGDSSDAPVRVPQGLPPIVQVRAGITATCAIDIYGGVHCWGDKYEPSAGYWSKITEVPINLQPAKQIGLGDTAACSIGLEGTLSCWGGDGYSNSQSGILAPPSGLILK